jgi:hypothetical protein
MYFFKLGVSVPFVSFTQKKLTTHFGDFALPADMTGFSH